MSNAKYLFDNGAYEILINKYKDSKKPEDIIYVLNSLIQLDKNQEAYELYKNSRNIVEKYDLISSIELFVNILISLEKTEELQKEIKAFEDYPYVNQETEEFINELNKYVKNLDNANKFDITIDSLLEKLESTDLGQMLDAYIYLKNIKNIDPDPFVFQILKKHEGEEVDIRHLKLLEFLVQDSYKGELCILKEGVKYLVDLEKLSEKYRIVDETLEECEYYSSRIEKDINVFKTISDLSAEFIAIFLPDIFTKEETYAYYSYVIELSLTIHQVSLAKSDLYKAFMKKTTYENRKKFESFFKNLMAGIKRIY